MEWCYIILAGDLNIDLLNGNKKSQRRYKDLHSFSLCQHITSPTRKSKTLSDHVISTIPDRVIHHDVLNTEELSDRETLYVIFIILRKRNRNRGINLYTTKISCNGKLCKGWGKCIQHPIQHQKFCMLDEMLDAFERRQILQKMKKEEKNRVG